MKAKIEGITGFKPFDLTITVESVEELKTLWSAANIADTSCLNNSVFENLKELPFELWNVLDKKCVEAGLK